ncbi:hypothetical protein [Pleomorphomonas sp. JP5]|uniref:hypothetical protein n=1 Tax=Pleomorphomonas sp. JP5 TaxID=2942998 RepID=UPI002043819C|nr:hypothetical protein [Pleomorphomonas sp. JP5]MCM5560299.1 hypothetical protein [Pleomorphomonas sp. JP5]
MTDLHCKPALRLINLRSALWSILGLPPSSTDGEIIAAVRKCASGRAEAPFGEGVAHPFILAVIDEDAP